MASSVSERATLVLEQVVTAARGELHLYNLRHVQHHTGQLSAYLRRIGQVPRWVDADCRLE